MKAFHKFLGVAALAATLIAGSSSQVRAEVPTLGDAEIQAIATAAPFNLINWKVGERMEYQVSVGFFGKIGSNIKFVDREEGDTIWIHQEMDLKIQKEVIDMQMSRVDGHIVKMIRNGQEMQVPNDKLEVISQDYGDVTVPAGKFAAVHVVAKTQQISKIELWANPAETVMDGGLKQIMSTQLGDITLELTAFKTGN